MKFLDLINKKTFKSYDDYLTYEVFKCDTELCKIRKAPVLAASLYRNGIQYLRRDPENGRIILSTKENLLIAINDHWAIFHEVFCARKYEFDREITNKPFVLFDLGMNRAYASLFFALSDNCRIIYGYEPHPETIEFAKYNIELNKNYLTTKNIQIKIFEYGLGKNDEVAILNGFVNRDGISTIEGCPNSVISQKELAKARRISVGLRSVTKDFDVRFSEIKGKNLHKILKIDVEGSEYVIIDELCKTGQIKKFDTIIGEAHDGISLIKNNLESNGFVLRHLGTDGNCNDFLFVKNEETI